MASPRTSWLILALALAGCTTSRTPLQADPLLPHQPGDGGVVIAESATLGLGGAVGKDASSSDCTPQGGLGVSVQTSLEQQDYVYDAHGEPCFRAQTLFDGRLLGKHQRAANPDVRIDFLDRNGPVLASSSQPLADRVIDTLSQPKFADELVSQPEAIAPAPESADLMPAELAAEAAAAAPTDPILGTLTQWQKDEDERVRRKVERELALRRHTERLGRDYTEDFQTKEALALAARLREAEKQVELQQQKLADAQRRSEEMRARLEQGQVVSQRNEKELRSQLDSLQTQNQDLMRRATRADKEQRLIQQEYEAKVASLKNNLNVAESEAATARQAAVLQAAQQIAEAEKLAYAARVAERQALEREAARLQAKADELAVKARSLPDTFSPPPADDLPTAYAQLTRREQLFNQKLARIPGEIVGGGDSLSQIQLILNEKDKPLADIFTQIFADVAPQLGQWQVRWEMSPQNQKLPQEPWTVTAETSFDEFLAYVTREVRKLHNIDLTFTRFDQNKVIVISD